MAVKLDRDFILRRITELYVYWKNPKSPLSNVESILIVKGKEEDVYSKTISLQLWMTQYELPDTYFLFCQQCIYVLASRKKAELFKIIESEKENENSGYPPIKILVKKPGTSDEENVSLFISAISESGLMPKVGRILKDKCSTEFWTALKSEIAEKNITDVDITQAIGLMLSMKDEKEIENLQKASEITCEMLIKHIRQQAIETIENDKKTKHSTVANGCEDALKNRKINLGLNVEMLDMCYPAIIQSGGNYSLKFSSESTNSLLRLGTMIFSVGVRYNSYCGNVIRTYLVNPSDSQISAYTFLYDVYEFAVQELREGIVINTFHSNILKYAKRKDPDLCDKLTRTFGFITGLEFRDNTMVIHPKNDNTLKNKMTFNFNIGLVNVDVKTSNGRSQKESYWIGDIVVIGGNAMAEPDGTSKISNRILTIKARSAPSKITMKIDEEDEEAEEEEEDSAYKSTKNSLTDKYGTINGQLGRGMRGTRLAEKAQANNVLTEDKRLEHQLELFEKLQNDVATRLRGLKSVDEDVKITKSTISYKGIGQIPKEDDVHNLRIFVDKKYETLVLPVYGSPVPFHISTIKSVTSSNEGDYTYLRINFYHPGAAINPKDIPYIPTEEKIFVKELTFRASNLRQKTGLAVPSTNLNTALRQTKELQKKYKAREAEEREMEDLVEQDKLLTLSKPYAKLKEVYMRPNIFGKRLLGNLETHQNGFRYINIRGEKIDIMFNNIKYCFFQPCDHEMIILVHFHLKNGVLLNKKKHIDIQFYTEVGEISTDLDGRGFRYQRDRDELDVEQREREQRNMLKAAFENFCNKSEQSSNDKVDFQRPFRELGFYGSPNRSNVLLQPTSNCLVQLVEWPPFVVGLDEIDFVHFERVSLNIKNFDTMIVKRNYREKPLFITAIPSTSLDHVKNWLDTNDLFFGEGLKSMNWVKLLKTVTDDPETFLEEGGWSFLKPVDNESENTEDEFGNEDNEFRPSCSGDEEDESGDSSEQSDDDDSEDWSAENESSDGDLDTDESSGKSWDELEAIAQKEDDNIELDTSRKRKPSPVMTSNKRRRRK